MIIPGYKFAAENGLTITAIEACLKAFKDRFEGHVETQGRSYLLDEEACSMILEIIKERELRFVSYDIQKEERKIWDEYHDTNHKKTNLFLEKLKIQEEIIELERKLREMEKEVKDIDLKLKELENQRDIVLPQKLEEFQKEAYKKWVYQKNCCSDEDNKE